LDISHAVKLAQKYPQVRFAHCGGSLEIRFRSDQRRSYFGYIDELPVSHGVIAAMRRRVKNSAFIAAKPFRRYYANQFITLVRNPLNRHYYASYFTGDWSVAV